MTRRPWLRYPAATIRRNCPNGYPYRSELAALSNRSIYDHRTRVIRCTLPNCNGWHITTKDTA